MNANLKFLGTLLAVLAVTFGIHVLALDAAQKPLWEHKIVLAYAVNFVLAAIILFLVLKNIKSGSAQAGFIFFGGSLLKFLVFFLVFQPVYKADGEMQTIEFATFFLPYAICLVLEVFYLSKVLNNQSS
ncbi:MAG: hypothetical protein KTR22_12535 [Flavobacteriaceae bacterium]|nr:hypothetical protein [Flavobacteriaceae bacterium]